MRVVDREERVCRVQAEPLELVRDVLPVVDELRADRGRRCLRVPDEARRRVVERARLPRVVRRLRGEDDGRAVRLERLARLDLVEDEGVDGLARRRADARLLAVPVAVRAPVVGRAERAAVVVPELDHDDVPRLHDVRDCGKAALVRVRARGAACDGVVDYLNPAQRLLEVLAPACVIGGRRKRGQSERGGAEDGTATYRLCRILHLRPPSSSRLQDRPSA